MKKSNPVLTFLAILALLFSLVIILFVDVDSLEVAKDLSYAWIAVVGGVLAFSLGFFYMFNKR